VVKPKNEGFLLVRADILPEAIQKTAQAKELLTRGMAKTVNRAAAMVGLSRSAFYKYRDGVFPFHQEEKGRIVTLSLTLEHRSGVLSKVLNHVAEAQGNILTINQGIPLQGVANVSISLETSGLKVALEGLVRGLEAIPGVTNIQLIGQSDGPG
jgi:chorismate mutase